MPDRFYPHRLKLVGPSKNFGFTQRATRVGPITLADVTYETDVALSFDQTRASYHVNIPLNRWLESRHRGLEITVTPEAASIFRPDGETTVNRWPGGTRNLAVKLDRAAVDGALEALIGCPVQSPIPFDGTLKLHAGAARRHRTCGSFPRLRRRPLDHWRRHLRIRRTPLNAAIQINHSSKPESNHATNAPTGRR